jgi:SAM-dependent methyltransferase
MSDPAAPPAFKDHFSAHAGSYARSRPGYPDTLFHFLAATAARQELAWDCATGNGQAAVSLARHFTRVVATDASVTQIAAAQADAGVEYRVVAAEDSGLDAASVDLISVAQALHWFDTGRFFAEAERVLRPGGVLAVWCYGICTVTGKCDRYIQKLYNDLEAYWPAERRLVETSYRDIALPMTPVECPAFSMTVLWNADAMLDYLGTWSACQRCRRESGADPTETVAAGLRAAWGEGARPVSWPLSMKASRAAAL